MRLFDQIITAIERNSRQTERRNLIRERYQLARERESGAHRLNQIEARLALLRGMDQEIAYGRPVVAKRRPIVEIIEDDATLPHHWHGYPRNAADDGIDGLSGVWRAPV